jgi:hypothetical protein
VVNSFARRDLALRAILVAFAAAVFSCGDETNAVPFFDAANGTVVDAASGAEASTEATAPDAMTTDATVDAPPSDASIGTDGDAGAEDAPIEDAADASDAPAEGPALSTEGGVPCRLSSDCADVPSTFCQKDSCDPNVVGTCSIIPGTQSTGYCSPADGGGFVCGCNGQTYPYACIAHAEQVNVASQGPCPLLQDGGACATNADCPSTAYCHKTACDAGTGTCEGRPDFQVCLKQIDTADALASACGCDHNTYYADCEAQSEGVNIDFEGVCPPPPSGPCTSQAECGGASYANIEFCRPTVCGQPAGVCTGIEGACPASSFGDDVCGCDGQFYTNECMSTWSRVGIAYGGPCRSGSIVPCDGGTTADGGSQCGPAQTCVLDPRTGCSGPSCPGVCVTGAGGSLGETVTDDGGYEYICNNTYTAKVPTLVSQSACDGGPCGSCGYTTGNCDAGLNCPGPSYCWPTGCTATGCFGPGYCLQTIPGCAMCAYKSASPCDANTPCPAGQLCFPSPGVCDGSACPGVCVVP